MALYDSLKCLLIGCTTSFSNSVYTHGVCERMHQTVGNILQTLIHTESPGTSADAIFLIHSALATTSHAVRTNVSQVEGYSPGALAFQRDMVLDVPLVIDLLQIRAKRQIIVDENLRRINAKRSSYNYVPT